MASDQPSSWKETMKAIPVEHAVGMILSHDVTRIVAGGEKGPAFRKGHIIQAADIPAFLDIGKQHVFVAECKWMAMLLE